MAAEACRKLKFYLQTGDKGYLQQGLDRIRELCNPRFCLPLNYNPTKKQVEHLLGRLVVEYSLV